MRIFPRVTFAALAAVLLLSGCVPTSPTVTPEPLPSSTPIFATEDDALAAATAAYAAYQHALDSAFASYDTSGLSNVAQNSALATAVASVADYKTSGKRQSGNSIIDKISLVNSTSALESSSFADPMQIYACLDVSAVDVRNSAGQSVVPANSAKRFPLIASLNWNSGTRSLVVTKEESWDGRNFC